MDRERGRGWERERRGWGGGGGLGWSSHQGWPCCYKNTFFHQPFYAKGEAQVLNQTSRLLFYFSSSPLPVLLHTNLLCAFPLPARHSSPPLPSLHVIRLPSCLSAACSPTDMRVTWRALRGQVIQGHWQVISADWLTSKRTSGRSQSGLAPSPPKADPPSPAHQQPVSHDQGEASEGGWLMMLLVPV